MNQLIITAYRGEARFLLQELNKFGEFSKSSFRDVLFGRVEDLDVFLEAINEEPPLSLARVIPLDDLIKFEEPEELLKELSKKVLDYEFEGSFKVIVERRGWKGVINSQEWAKELGGIIYEELGQPVDLTEPDFLIIIEIMSDSCGITLLSRELLDKYFFIRF